MAAGIAFGYFIVLDPAVHFLTNYDTQFDFKPRAKSYYSFVTLIMVATAIVFELPVFILAMARIGILPADRLRRNRRMGYVIVAALAVALPGVDPVTTTLEMIPLMILFEASIWLAVFFDRRWKRDAQAREASWQAEYGDFGDFDDDLAHASGTAEGFADRIRALALSFPETYEDEPWGHPVFKVADNRMFAAISSERPFS